MCDNISEFISAREIEMILVHLGIDPDYSNVRGCCPIHGGDNQTAFSMNVKRGRWKCWTSSCHDRFGGDIVGIWAGIKDVSRVKATYQIQRFIKREVTFSEDDVMINKVLKSVKEKTEPTTVKPIPIRYFENKSVSNYFVKQGFTEETLRHFKVSYCDKTGVPMAKRHFLPLPDVSGKYALGVTGRTAYPLCPICGGYHHPKMDCPDKPFPKWKNWGIVVQNYLYNLNNAIDSIRDKRWVIVTEGPKEVWYLHQLGIRNVVSTLGKNFFKEQSKLLCEAGALSVVLCYDNDKEGRTAAKRVKKENELVYNFYHCYSLMRGYKDLCENKDTEQIRRYFHAKESIYSK